MFISVSAAALNKYKWYQYLGKKTLSFEDHNPKYDLDLEHKVKFGVRKYAGKLKLAVLAEPDIVFTLSEAEVDKVLKLSKGWSGTVKGIKLEAGVGGKDAKRESRLHDPDAKKSSKYFPDFPMPPKKSDILRLYHYFNKLHFKNECPEKLKIEFPDALKFSGQAQLTLRLGVPSFTLKLAKKALTDRVRIIEIVLHEMIHLLHYKRYYVDGNALYNGAGHGPLFLEEMHRLNKFGYNINTKEYDLVEAKLDNAQHVLLLYLGNGSTCIVHSDKPFKSRADAIVELLRARIATSIGFERYLYGTTTSSYVYEGMRLPKSGQFGRKKKLSAFKSNSAIVVSIEKALRVEREQHLKVERGDIRPKFQAAVDSCVTVIDQSLDRFLGAAMVIANIVDMNSPDLRNRTLDLSRKLLTPAEIEYAERKWLSIEDRHILNSEHFKFTRRDLLKYRLDGQEGINWIGRCYDKPSYQGRIDYQRFAKICVQAFGDIMTVPDNELERGIIKAAKEHWEKKK